MALKTVNEKIQDEVIHHSAVDLMRVEAGLRKKVLSDLRKLETDLIKEVAATDVTGVTRTDFQTARLNALLKQTQKTIRTSYKDIDADQAAELYNAAQAEMMWAAGTVNGAIGVNLASVAINHRLLEELSKKSLVEGRFPKQWWGKQAGDYADRFEGAMRDGMLRGETVNQLIKRVKDIGTPVRRHAESQVRTSYMTVVQRSREKAYDDMRDVLKGYKYSAALDNRTTEYCIASDGTIFDLEYNVTQGPDWVNTPPNHWQCRSSLVPITKSWAELRKQYGVKGKKGKKLAKMPERTRASMDGKVPADTKYDDWLRTKPAGFQDRVLGPVRAKMFREGKVKSVAELLDQTGNILTIEKLTKRISDNALFNTEELLVNKPLRLKKVKPLPKQAITVQKAPATPSPLPKKVAPKKATPAVKKAIPKTPVQKYDKLVSDIKAQEKELQKLAPEYTTQSIFEFEESPIRVLSRQLVNFEKDLITDIPLDTRVARIKAWKVFSDLVGKEESAHLSMLKHMEKTEWAGKRISDIRKLSELPQLAKDAEKNLNKFLLLTKDRRIRGASDIGRLEDGIKTWRADAAALAKIELELVKKTRGYRYTWLNSLDDDAYQIEKQKIIRKLLTKDKKVSKEVFDAFVKDSELALDFAPIDLLSEMQSSGYKIRLNAGKGRAFAIGKDSNLFVGDPKGRINDIAHEFSHSIDSFLAGNRGAGRVWTNNGNWVPKGSGKKYQAWYTKQHSGKRGKFTNGDGAYFQGDFINTYEGRIYDRGNTMAQEWWTMNMQRYSANRIVNHKLVSRTEILGDLSGPKALLFRDYKDWNRAKSLYPELTEFIDKTFSKRIMAKAHRELVEEFGEAIVGNEWKGLAAEASADVIKAEAKLKRRIAALKNKKLMDRKKWTIANDTEIEVSEGIKGDWITGNRPFDVFLDNEFIEIKTVVDNSNGLEHYLSVKKSSRALKDAFVKKYKVRGHIVAIDKTPGSPTYGQMFYRKGYGSFKLKTMTLVRDYDHLQELLKKGAQRITIESESRTIAPAFKTKREAAAWFKGRNDVDIDLGNINLDASQDIVGYMDAAIRRLEVKPTKVVIDKKPFIGKRQNTIAVATQDGKIAFNPKFMRSKASLERLASEQFDINQFTTKSVGHVFRHETAHLRYFALGGTEGMAETKLSTKWVKELYSGIGRTDLPNYVSNYALKSEGEFYAEMMALKLNGEQVHPVAQRIVDAIERKLKRNLRNTQ